MVPVPAAAQTASSAIGAAVATSKCRPNINSGTATIVPPAPVNARIRPTTMPIAMLIAGSAAAAGEIGRHRNIHQLWIRQLQCLHQFDVLRACLAGQARVVTLLLADRRAGLATLVVRRVERSAAPRCGTECGRPCSTQGLTPH